MKQVRINMRHREAFTGLFFVAPFLIGSLAFFFYPVLSSFTLSFGETDKAQAGFHILVTGLQNYHRAFFEDINFVPLLLNVVRSTLINVPLIVVVSLLLAIMLNKLTWLKGFFRVVVLLPFLLGTGEVMQQLLSQKVDQQIISIANSELIPRDFLVYLGNDIMNLLDTLFGRIVNVLWSSGVQTLLFLSAIQNISTSLYESAKIDGANEYEMFWKITLPMVSPVMLLIIIYTIINSFTDTNNGLLAYIQTQTTFYAQHGYAAAMGWIYFAFILLLILAISLFIGGYVRHNQVEGRKA